MGDGSASGQREVAAHLDRAIGGDAGNLGGGRASSVVVKRRVGARCLGPSENGG
jgi:hypothetical protein